MNISLVLFTGHDSSFRTVRRSPVSSDGERSPSPMPTEDTDTFSIRSAQKKPETLEAYEQAEEESPFSFSAPSLPSSKEQPFQMSEPVLFAEPERPKYDPTKKRLSFAEQLRRHNAEQDALEKMANASLGGGKASRQETSGSRGRKGADPYIRPLVQKSSKSHSAQLPESSTSAASSSSRTHTAFSLPFDNSRRKP